MRSWHNKLHFEILRLRGVVSNESSGNMDWGNLKSWKIENRRLEQEVRLATAVTWPRVSGG